MLHHPDSLKIRIDYFRPKHPAMPSADALLRAMAFTSNRYALHISLLSIAVVVAVAGALS